METRATLCAAFVIFGCVSVSPAGVLFPVQDQLGNVFTEGVAVRIEARIDSGSRIDWTIGDFRGATVESGVSPVEDHRAAIAPRATGCGYYLVRITARDGDHVVGQGQTSYAVVPRLDARRMADARFGVMTHFAKNMGTDILPLISRAGITQVRDELAWSQVEKERGVFDFTAGNDHLNRYMSELRKAGIVPLEVMAFGNKLHFGAPDVPPYQAAPYDQPGYDAYANYCAAVLKQYGTQMEALEIWNEYNGSFCAGPAAADRPRFYTAMLQVAYSKIKSVRPDVTVAGGALIGLPVPYCEKLFRHGALQYMDALVVHAYKREPEGIERQVAALVALMKQYNHGQAKPIWVTETGTWQDQSMERAGSASYLVRMYTLLLTEPLVERIYWYLLRDFQEFTVEGLLHGDGDPMGKYTPVAAYPAYANLIRQLHGARFVGREPTDPRTRVYQFRSQERTIWVAWSTSGAAQLAFETAAPLRRIDLVGGQRKLTPVRRNIAVTLDDVPMYVVAEGAGAVTVTEVPRPDRVLADSVSDYSGEQARGGWTYFYYLSNRDGSAAYGPAKVQPMTWGSSAGDGEYRWAGPGDSLHLSEEAASPAAIGGGQAWAVRRWTSGSARSIRIVGDAVTERKKGDGVGVRVYLDGREVFTKMLTPGAKAHIDLPLAVTKGSHLDFAVTPGGGLDTGFDSTFFHVMILVDR